MENSTQILTLPELALQYGTITQDQFNQVNKLFLLKEKEGNPSDFGEIILKLRLATNYQVGLLKLIQEYLILKKRGEEFGKIAVSKGYATQEDVDKALELQKKEFKRAKIKKLIGDILVDSQVITVKQRNAILKEQSFLERQAQKILSKGSEEPKTKETPQAPEPDVSLTKYDKQFLKTKVLDKEFAASIMEKKIATKKDVTVAQKLQEEEFEKENRIRILGDIMVELNQISEEQKNKILKEQDRLDPETAEKVNTGIQVEISPDRMEATILIEKDIKTVHLPDVKQALQTNGIKFGIYPDAILQGHLDTGNTTFIGARQDFSVELIKNRKAIYHFDTSTISSDSLDMGATLAEQDLGPSTYTKKDLFGENIEQPSGYDFTFRCGFGTRLSKDQTKAFAGKSGFPSLSIERKLHIHPPVNVLDDADLKYGALENYANLKILGVLTGAYPVKAGTITAREIRGAQIEAIGDITSQIGITGANINTQGDIHATYIHNSTILAFGDVYVENEIIDSQIFCSGKIKSGKCRVISSDVYGKKGVELAGAGNSRTRPCVIAAGTEHHLIEIYKLIKAKIDVVAIKLDELKENIFEQDSFRKKTFQKMVDLKIFHDRAKEKKEALKKEFDKKKKTLPKEKLKNIATLLNNFKKRMDSSIVSLKKLNEKKKKSENKKLSLEKKLIALEKKVEKEICELKIDLASFFEWARRHENNSKIKINASVFPGTVFKGIFSELILKDENLSSYLVYEKQVSTKEHSLQIKNI